jgi:hypothetical protein
MRFWWIALAIFVWLGATTLEAQTTMPSSGASASSLTPAETLLNEMLHPSTSMSATLAMAKPTTQPADTQMIRPDGYAAAKPQMPLLREGSDVIARKGYLQKVSGAAYSQIVFVNDPSQPKIAPMYALPNLQLMSMEDAAAQTGKSVIFSVSGMVTEYCGKNYILLAPGPEDASRQLAPPSLSPNLAPVSADQMLSDMLSADNRDPGAPPAVPAAETNLATGPNALPPQAPTLMVLRERSQIFDRVCRLSHSPDGQHEQLTFESDGTTLEDPPLLVLPNLKLAALEAASSDRDARFRVTGTITEYRGRNYILLQKVLVMADSDRQF